MNTRKELHISGPSCLVCTRCKHRNTKEFIKRFIYCENCGTPPKQTTERVTKQLLVEGSIVLKAYEIDLGKLSEGYLSEPIICHAESLNKAKVKLLEEVKYSTLELLYSDEVINYLNIPVKRRKASDIIIFEGEEVLRYQVDQLINERGRIAELDGILDNPSIKYCYIIKGIYYRPNSCGYTSLKFEAGVYPKDEAVSHAKSVSQIRLERVDIEEHNKMINQKIAELQERLL